MEKNHIAQKSGLFDAGLSRVYCICKIMKFTVLPIESKEAQSQQLIDFIVID